MGVDMTITSQAVTRLQSGMFYVAIPLLLLAMQYYPERAVLKEFLSGLTIVAFCLASGQFFWTQGNRYLARSEKGKKFGILHNSIGYMCIVILLLHPFVIVFPRYYEHGLDPGGAFVIMVTTLTSTGVVLGLISWLLLLTLGLTTFFRKNFLIRYVTWQRLHGILALSFLITASWHAIDLGRHTGIGMSMLLVLFGCCGMIIFFNRTRS